MKRFYLFALLFFVSLPVLAATKNKISMVTYFPVPYVAYSQVNTTEQMDIGLTSACSMKLGCSETSSTLNAARVNLKGGKLNLDGGRGIKGYTLSLGSGNGDGKILFQNVRIQTGTMESVNAGDIKAANLNLFGKTFPSCKSANSESGGQMQWANLKLKGASSNELYLMCGKAIEGENPCVNEPIFTAWDSASGECVCPGVNAGYLITPEGEEMCCSDSTPKSNTSCWKAVEKANFRWMAGSVSDTYSVPPDPCQGNCQTPPACWEGYTQCGSSVKEGLICDEDHYGWVGEYTKYCIETCDTVPGPNERTITHVRKGYWCHGYPAGEYMYEALWK